MGESSGAACLASASVPPHTKARLETDRRSPVRARPVSTASSNLSGASLQLETSRRRDISGFRHPSALPLEKILRTPDNGSSRLAMLPTPELFSGVRSLTTLPKRRPSSFYRFFLLFCLIVSLRLTDQLVLPWLVSLTVRVTGSLWKRSRSSWPWAVSVKSDRLWCGRPRSSRACGTPSRCACASWVCEQPRRLQACRPAASPWWSKRPSSGSARPAGAEQAIRGAAVVWSVISSLPRWCC